MVSEQERILVVESDPEASDLIARQALHPMGYRIKVVGSASEAIQQAVLFSPHLVVTSLDLPDLSGKDLLVALSSQGIKTPVIMIAEKGREADVIQTFRLGASDYLTSPVREAELVSVVERALKQTRARREREQLARQLKQTNQELQRRVRELTTIFAIGKAVTSITDQSTLFDRIVEGAVFITDAQLGWILVREDVEDSFFLRAHRNLPKAMVTRMKASWDDGISSLVALSGETLSIHGDPLRRFPIAQLGQSALVVPVKVRGETIGLLVVMRKAASPFGNSDQTMLEAVADYASISLANARLFRAVEERAKSFQQAMEHSRHSERSKDEKIRNIGEELRQPLLKAKEQVDLLAENKLGQMSDSQRESITAAEKNLQRVLRIVDSMSAMGEPGAPGEMTAVSVNSLVKQAISRNQHIAHPTGLALLAELPTDEVLALADENQLKQVLDGLITNAVKFSPQGGQITIRVQKTEDDRPHVIIRDTGMGIEDDDLAHIFDSNPPQHDSGSVRYSGLGIRLSFIRDIITAHGGNIWAESEAGQGSAFHFTLRSPK